MEKERTTMQKMTKVVTQNRDLTGCYRAHCLPLLSLQMCLVLFDVTVREEQMKKDLAWGNAGVGDIGHWEGQRLMRTKIGEIEH